MKGTHLKESPCVCFHHIFLVIQQIQHKISDLKILLRLARRPTLQTLLPLGDHYSQTSLPQVSWSHCCILDVFIFISNIPPTSQFVFIHALPHITEYWSNCCFHDLPLPSNLTSSCIHDMIIIVAQFSHNIVVSSQFQSTSCFTTRCLPTS